MVSKRRRGTKKQLLTPDSGARPPATDHSPLIVGVGASAGGLQAFTQLLKHLPPNPGMALVLVQHLAPRHASALTELLSRTTKMPVAEVTKRIRIEKNHVYVIPPDRDMEVRRGELHLVPRVKTQPHMPIDYFMNSLAADRGPKAVGVIFSGTASDGTLGLKAIKAAGGITFAQDPERADHAEMPRNAIAAGVVDFALPIDAIAKELLRIAEHPYLRQPPEEAREEAKEEAAPQGESERRQIYRILRTTTGVDFTHYKPSTLVRRIRRRMVLRRLDSLRAYASYLAQHQEEVDALFQDMLIHVTGFFRDPQVFETLKTSVFPNLLKDHPTASPIRVWVSGCSTGEETYSIAMTLLEFMADAGVSHEVQIFGTDVNNAALDKARQGEYIESIAADVTPERLRRFFTKLAHGYRVTKRLRDMCVFARHDIAKDPPFSHLDLITCRNLLIYLGPILQKRILPLFHYALKPTGYLLLGSSETIGSFTDSFTLLDKQHKLYKPKPNARPPIVDFGTRVSAVNLAGAGTDAEPGQRFDLQKEADRILLNRFSPPGAVVDEELQVLQFHGRTGRYLEPAPGNATLNLAKMVRGGLAVDLRAAVQEARKGHHSVKKRGLLMRQNGHTMEVDLDVIPIRGPSAAVSYFLVLFRESRPERPQPGSTAKGLKARPAISKAGHREIGRLKDELAQTKGTLQSAIEELEAANEELRSANEESLSSNEELQSTNEELETAKEELQSANEELTTLNEELQNRNNELNVANNDLINLLGSINIPILMLGNDLRIRRFTPAVQQLISVMKGDLGRSASDLKLKFDLPHFDKLIADAIDNVTVKDLEVQTFEGRWYAMQIRPYKTA